MVLDFENIHVQYGRKEILYGVDLSVEKGKITGIVGPNGCGKSTLVKTVFGIAPMKEGQIILEGQDTGKMTRKELSEKLGYVGQETACVFDFTVEDIIGMALYNRKKEKTSSKEIIRPDQVSCSEDRTQRNDYLIVAGSGKEAHDMRHHKAYETDEWKYREKMAFKLSFLFLP